MKAGNEMKDSQPKQKGERATVVGLDYEIKKKEVLRKYLS